MKIRIEEIIKDSIATKQGILNDASILMDIQKITGICISSLQADKKLLFCGNGGSAADAQHLAAEFSGRFYKDREPLFAEALHVNSSYMTAVANDYSFTHVYERIIRAKGRKDDILFAISTSGNSENIILALQEAKKQGMITIGFSGKTGGKMKSLCDYCICVPSSDTPRIQEAHIMIGHIICELVEAQIFD